MPLDSKKLATCLAVLKEAQELAPDDPDYLLLERTAAHLRKTAKKKRKNIRMRRNKERDARIMASTTLGGAEPCDASEPRVRQLHNVRNCYRCKQPYRKVHHHYHLMCCECGELCLQKREQRSDLCGRRALVTGGRTKIGFAVALKLLRDGAQVHVTTRFPKDAARRYLAQPDCADWRDRLHIQEADFRKLPKFLALVEQWKQGPAFDILINNAAQTVWHPPEYYRSLWAGEDRPFEGPAWIEGPAASYPQLPVAVVADALFPVDCEDAFGNQIDLRRENSWVQHLGEINAVEMVEVQVVNSIAPFVLCNELLDNMQGSAFTHRFIINVAAAEGQFNRSKLSRHPHTNMAKAALNMLTCTSTEDCAARDIFMVSVDPGWMSHEGPQAANGDAFHPPLEAADSAARIYDPIVSGIAGTPIFGVLLKDFREIPW